MLAIPYDAITLPFFRSHPLTPDFTLTTVSPLLTCIVAFQPGLVPHTSCTQVTKVANQPEVDAYIWRMGPAPDALH
mgnify:CR=1 FL=1